MLISCIHLLYAQLSELLQPFFTAVVRVQLCMWQIHLLNLELVHCTVSNIVVLWCYWIESTSFIFTLSTVKIILIYCLLFSMLCVCEVTSDGVGYTPEVWLPDSLCMGRLQFTLLSRVQVTKWILCLFSGMCRKCKLTNALLDEDKKQT